MTAFLDTNIVIYAALGRETDPGKYLRAVEIIRGGDYVTSAQIHAEFYFQVTRPRHAMPHTEAIGWLEQLRQFDVVHVTGELVAQGAEIARRYLISYWDGAIVAAAQTAKADRLYSEDLNSSQIYGSVRVINPFADTITA